MPPGRSRNEAWRKVGKTRVGRSRKPGFWLAMPCCGDPTHEPYWVVFTRAEAADYCRRSYGVGRLAVRSKVVYWVQPPVADRLSGLIEADT